MTYDVWERITWFDDWQRFSVLPYGSHNLGDEPGFVFDVISICHNATEQALVEINQNA